jgi:hypothetical protein
MNSEKDLEEELLKIGTKILNGKQMKKLLYLV